MTGAQLNGLILNLTILKEKKIKILMSITMLSKGGWWLNGCKSLLPRNNLANLAAGWRIFI